MSLLDLLDQPIVYHRVYRRITGKTVAGLLLSQLVYWQRIVDEGRGGINGWFYKTSREIEEETGLSRHEQVTARNCLTKLKIIETKKGGLPCRLFYQVDLAFLIKKLKQYHHDREIKRVANNIYVTEAETGKQSQGAIVEYIEAAIRHKKPNDPVAYAACIRKRLGAQGGLSEADFEQLRGWKCRENIPHIEPGNVIDFGIHKIKIKEIQSNTLVTNDGANLPIGPIIKDILAGSAKLIR